MEILGVTGHRPHLLHGYTKDAHDVLSLFARRYLRKRQKEIRLVNVGMAMGFDMAVARACDDLGIPYTAYLPYPDQCKYWSSLHKDLWHKYVEKADSVVTCYSIRELVNICAVEKVARSLALDKRNHRIVDNSTELVSLWSGASGGTANCIKYATKTRTKHTNVYASYAKFANFILG